MHLEVLNARAMLTCPLQFFDILIHKQWLRKGVKMARIISAHTLLFTRLQKFCCHAFVTSCNCLYYILYSIAINKMNEGLLQGIIYTGVVVV